MGEIEAPTHGLLMSGSFRFWVCTIGEECEIANFQNVCFRDTKRALSIELVLRSEGHT